jgi:hypothetical protein
MDVDVDDDALQSMLGEEEDDADDVKRLAKAWVKERGTQAIMQWEGDLMDELFDKLEQQVCLSLRARAKSDGPVHGHLYHSYQRLSSQVDMRPD